MNDLKLKQNLELERTNMIIAEYESKQLNSEVQIRQMISAIEAIDEGMKIKNLFEARRSISYLGNMLKQNLHQLEDQNNRLKIQDNYIKSKSEKLLEMNQNLRDESEMRLFYQHLLLKFIRDSKMFEHDKVK